MEMIDNWQPDAIILDMYPATWRRETAMALLNELRSHADLAKFTDYGLYEYRR
ncbi:hypothetical protein KOY48_01680 [Candidatus Minimicrobia naudis]|uniref:Uncharacterized protein n=1 Tax=Candidatus Minimicrobia naudis TaxID=2841263 RepID=A0A8F1SC21_9BACT|nr:hypothetical protein KOY48_01680 [Candidatus Minimicrobia naudis]